MEFIFGLFTGYLLNFTALWTLIFLCVISEACDNHKTAVFLGILVTAIAYFMFRFPAEYLLYGAVAYFIVGICWSVWRYKRYVDYRIEQASDRSKGYMRDTLQQLHPRYMTGELVTWVLIWPFSMLSNLTRDIIVLVTTVITDWMRGVYLAIHTSAVAKANARFPEDKET